MRKRPWPRHGQGLLVQPQAHERQVVERGDVRGTLLEALLEVALGRRPVPCYQGVEQAQTEIHAHVVVIDLGSLKKPLPAGLGIAMTDARPRLGHEIVDPRIGPEGLGLELRGLRGRRMWLDGLARGGGGDRRAEDRRHRFHGPLAVQEALLFRGSL